MRSRSRGLVYEYQLFFWGAVVLLYILVPRFLRVHHTVQTVKRLRAAREGLPKAPEDAARYVSSLRAPEPPDHRIETRQIVEGMPDQGGWGYKDGRLWVDCTHTDVRGRAWSSY